MIVKICLGFCSFNNWLLHEENRLSIWISKAFLTTVLRQSIVRLWQSIVVNYRRFWKHTASWQSIVKPWQSIVLHFGKILVTHCLKTIDCLVMTINCFATLKNSLRQSHDNRLFTTDNRLLAISKNSFKQSLWQSIVGLWQSIVVSPDSKYKFENHFG